MITPNQLEKYSKQLFSDESSERRKARKKLIHFTNNFKNYPEINKKERKKCPTWLLISEWMEQALEEELFPYKIAAKKPGKIVAEYNTIDEPPPKRVSNHSLKPAYVVMMAHAIPKDKSLDQISKQIKLLNEQGFGDNKEDGIEKSEKRLRIVIGANFRYSLDSRVNRACKKYIAQLEELTNERTHFVTFAWSPKWVPCDKSEKINPDIKRHKEAERFFNLLLKVNKKCAENLLAEAMEEKITVPMQTIREQIKDSPILKEHLKALRGEEKTRPCYLACWDDDAIKLRQKGKMGPFSEYDTLIAKNKKLKIASTGYTMEDPKRDHIAFASNCDRIGRIALAECAYPPEPNFIIAVGGNLRKSLKKISFLRLGGQKGKGLEAIGILHNLGLDLRNAQGQYIFGKSGPIVTACNRAEVPKRIPARLSADDLRESNILKSLRSFMQTSLNPTQGFAASILRMIPKSNTAKNRGLISAFLTSFDPIDYAKSFDNWPQLYPGLTSKLHKMHQKKIDDPTYKPDFKAKAKKIHKEYPKNSNKKEIKDFLKTRFDILWEAHEKVKKQKNLTNHDAIIYQKGKTVGQSLYEHLMKEIEKRN